MPASSSENARQKWRKGTPKTTKRHRPEDEEDDDEENENDAVEPDDDEDLHSNPNPNPNPNPNVSEVVGGSGTRISDFPPAVKYTVIRAHPFVGTIVAMERAALRGERERGGGGNGVVLENVSYGQLQVVSAVAAEGVALVGAGDQEGSAPYVVTPPPIMEGSGVVKSFWDMVHVVPKHADWFSPTMVHRLERQVVPHFFSSKSADHTPEKYIDCRNVIVAKYMEDPSKILSVSDCQGLALGVDNEDLNRIFRFLDHWGIINYCAPGPNRESWNIESYLREETNGEVVVPSVALKSVDSLIKFDKPKCRLKPGDVNSTLSSNAEDISDFDSCIREKLSENHCNYCSRPLLVVYYQSLKEADALLCPDCYHEGRFVAGHSSIDFARTDSTKDYADMDGENWTDQETLLLLEAVEIYNDNWNEIAEHVGTKSKAQCILHFLRLPMEDGLLEKVDVPNMSSASNTSNMDDLDKSDIKPNGDSAGSHIQDSDSENRFPFANSGNPVMTLVAFLASTIGPRIAAACAHASLAALSEDDGLPSFGHDTKMDESMHANRTNSDDGTHGKMRNSGQQKEGNRAVQVSEGQNNAELALTAEKVKSAAKAGLAAAAIKAKLFADHEEREIQRLSANIINHQLKRLELKLKQFAEVETLLMKECEQVEKARQRLAGERARVVAARFGPSGVASTMNMPGVTSQVVDNSMSSNRPPTMSASPSQPAISGFGSTQMNLSQMSFISRQQMLSFGPRLPLSAIQPPSKPLPSGVGFSSQAGAQSSLSHHPMLRPGTSSSLG